MICRCSQSFGAFYSHLDAVDSSAYFCVFASAVVKHLIDIASSIKQEMSRFLSEKNTKFFLRVV